MAYEKSCLKLQIIFFGDTKNPLKQVSQHIEAIAFCGFKTYPIGRYLVGKIHTNLKNGCTLYILYIILAEDIH